MRYSKDMSCELAYPRVQSSNSKVSQQAYDVFKPQLRHFGPGTGVRKSFREIQSRNQPPHFTNRTLLGSTSKFRIAFELSQACLLFLRTQWFSTICSCGIRCGRRSASRDGPDFDFTLRLGTAEHEPSRWANTQMDSCWGRNTHNWNTLTKPIRRLALLLIEVTLGTTVLETRCDSRGAIISITFVEGAADNLRRTAHSLDYVMENVRQAAYKSRAYKEAVKYCAVREFPQTPDDAQTKILLADLYRAVVVP